MLPVDQIRYGLEMNHPKARTVKGMWLKGRGAGSLADELLGGCTNSLPIPTIFSVKWALRSSAEGARRKMLEV